jgi:hypothetical protein
MAAKDYYGILGVNKKATDEEIKRAYRKMAMRSCQAFSVEGEDGNPDSGEEGDLISEIFSQGKAVIRIRVGCLRKERIFSMRCPSP